MLCGGLYMPPRTHAAHHTCSVARTAAARKSAREEAKAAAAAAKAAKEAQLVREALARAAADPSDTGAVEAAVEVDYEGDTAEVLLAEGGVAANDRVYDVGSETREAMVEAVAAAATVVWTGPLGVVEVADCQGGTRELAEAVAEATRGGATTLVGACRAHAFMSHPVLCVRVCVAGGSEGGRDSPATFVFVYSPTLALAPTAGGSTVAWLNKLGVGGAAVTQATSGCAAVQRLLQGGLLPGAAVLSEADAQ